MADLVYMMILYKNLAQALRVIDRLDGPHVSFVIHIDRKTDSSFVRAARTALADRRNCHFIDRLNVHWAAWGLVQVQLDGARYVEERSIPCDFFIYMSGQDYPLVPNAVIDKHFDGNIGRQFLEHFALPYAHWPEGGMTRVKSFHFQLGKRHLTYPPRPDSLPTTLRPLLRVLPMRDRSLPAGYTYFGGSAAITLAANGISYINRFVTTPVGRRLVRYFKYARHADEIFFQTVFMNSALRDTVVNDDLRYVDWDPPVGPAPKFLDMSDYEKLRTSGKLFARKFDTSRDVAILDALDQQP